MSDALDSQPFDDSVLPKKASMSLIDFAGFPLNFGCLESSAKWLVENTLPSSPPKLIFHINVNAAWYLLKNPSIKSTLVNEASLILDGIGMKIAAKIMGKQVTSDLNGTDLFPIVMNLLQDSQLSVYLLGASEQTVQRAAENSRSAHPNLNLAGYSGGYFSIDGETDIINSINRSGAKILLVGRGLELEADFILRNYKKLSVNLIWSVGGLFDFVSGDIPRAPLSMRRIHLEWLFRLLIDPKAKLYRNVIAMPRFILFILLQRIQKLFGLSHND